MILKFTARDFDEYFDLLKIKATEIFPDWTDFNDSNIGVVFLELLSAVGDQFSFYHNQQCNEMFLPTVQRRRNALKILKKMNYVMDDYIPASVDVEFTFEGGGTHSEDVTIYENTQVSDENGDYIFETTEDITISAGNSNGIVTVKNWVSQEDDFTFDGSIHQEKTLHGQKFIQVDRLEIASQLWTQVDDFIDSGATDRHFKVEVDDRLRAVLVFGNGVNGQKPSGIGTVNYKTGGGTGANSVQPSAINTIITTIKDVLSNPVSMEVTNALSPSGGEDYETVDEARKKAPSASRVQNNTVSRDDYEGNAELVDGVARALAIGKREDSAIEPARVQVIVVPEGGGTPSSGLLDDVENYLYKIKPIMMTTEIDAVNPTYNTITIAGIVNKKDGFTASAVKTAVDNALIQYFSYDNLDDQNKYTMDFGYYLPLFYLSKIIDIIMNTTINGIECVDSVTLTSPTGNISISMKEIPALGSLTGLTVS